MMTIVKIQKIVIMKIQKKLGGLLVEKIEIGRRIIWLPNRPITDLWFCFQFDVRHLRFGSDGLRDFVSQNPVYRTRTRYLPVQTTVTISSGNLLGD